MKLSKYLIFPTVLICNFIYATEPDLIVALNKNGTSMLCSSEEYRKCLMIDEKTCMSELSDLPPDCLESAKSDLELFGTNHDGALSYALCMSISHLKSKHSAKLEEIQSCNKKERTNMDSIVDAYLSANNLQDPEQ
jgi:hypothetical protein